MHFDERLSRTAILYAGIAALAIGGDSVRAAQLTFHFSGTIASVNDSSNVLGGAVSIGTPFAGHYTFDPNVNDSSANTTARYASVGAEYEYTVTVGGYTFSRNGNDGFPGIPIYVSDGLQDAYAVNTNVNVSAAPGMPPSIGNVRSHI